MAAAAETLQAMAASQQQQKPLTYRDVGLVPAASLGGVSGKPFKDAITQLARDYVEMLDGPQTTRIKFSPMNRPSWLPGDVEWNGKFLREGPATMRVQFYERLLKDQRLLQHLKDKRDRQQQQR
jgi:hypothetical protein